MSKQSDAEQDAVKFLQEAVEAYDQAHAYAKDAGMREWVPLATLRKMEGHLAELKQEIAHGEKR